MATKRERDSFLVDVRCWKIPLLNPFTVELPVTAWQIHVPSTSCDIISFNCQGQLCPITCAKIFQTIPEWAQSSQEHQRKKATNHVTLTWKFPWKSCPTAHLPFLSSNSKILKAFWKIFPTKMKPTKCPAKEKKWGKKSEKEGEERKRRDCYVTF